MISVKGMGKLSPKECREKISAILASMANGILRGDKSAEDYMLSAFSNESELSVLTRALIQSRKQK
jgi:hypothetical protein